MSSIFQATKPAVDEFIEVLDFGFKFIEGTKLALADGKIDVQDTAAFIPALIALPPAVLGAGGSVDVFKTFSPEEQEKILEFVSVNFPDLSDDGLESLIKETVQAVFGLVALVRRWIPRFEKRVDE